MALWFSTKECRRPWEQRDWEGGNEKSETTEPREDAEKEKKKLNLWYSP